MQLKRAGPAITAAQVPRLTTDRLVLRGFELADLPAASRMWRNPAVIRYIGGNTRSAAEVWQRLQASFGSWYLLGFGYWAIEERASSRFIGQIGFMEALRDINPSHIGSPEAGWALDVDAWGKGYASEALAAALDWADRAFDAATVPHTTCIISADHAASIRVATKSGYQEARRTDFDGSRTCVYHRPTPA